jgi:hypothetical protein
MINETTYQNRRGDTYFAHVKQTKTGALTYYAAKTRDAAKAAVLPPEFEFYESPTTAVSIRRRLVSDVTDVEHEAVGLAVDALCTVALDTVKLDRTKSSVVVWLADEPFTAQDEAYGMVPNKAAFPLMFASARLRRMQFMAVMRFTPVSPRETKAQATRQFFAERYCWRGSVDAWIPIGSGSLNELLKKFIPHLGKDSFFELLRG